MVTRGHASRRICEAQMRLAEAPIAYTEATRCTLQSLVHVHRGKERDLRTTDCIARNTPSGMEVEIVGEIRLFHDRRSDGVRSTSVGVRRTSDRIPASRLRLRDPRLRARTSRFRERGRRFRFQHASDRTRHACLHGSKAPDPLRSHGYRRRGSRFRFSRRYSAEGAYVAPISGGGSTVGGPTITIAGVVVLSPADASRRSRCMDEAPISDVRARS